MLFLLVTWTRRTR